MLLHQCYSFPNEQSCSSYTLFSSSRQHREFPAHDRIPYKISLPPVSPLNSALISSNYTNYFFRCIACLPCPLTAPPYPIARKYSTFFYKNTTINIKYSKFSPKIKDFSRIVSNVPCRKAIGDIGGTS